MDEWIRAENTVSADRDMMDMMNTEANGSMRVCGVTSTDEAVLLTEGQEQRFQLLNDNILAYFAQKHAEIVLKHGSRTNAFQITSGFINVGLYNDTRTHMEDAELWALPALIGPWRAFVVPSCIHTVHDPRYYALKAVHTAHTHRKDWVRLGKGIGGYYHTGCDCDWDCECSDELPFYEVAIYDTCQYPSDEDDMDSLSEDIIDAASFNPCWGTFNGTGIACITSTGQRTGVFPVYGLFDGEQLVGVKILFIQEPEDTEAWVPGITTADPTVVNAAPPAPEQLDECE